MSEPIRDRPKPSRSGIQGDLWLFPSLVLERGATAGHARGVLSSGRGWGRQ